MDTALTILAYIIGWSIGLTVVIGIPIFIIRLIYHAWKEGLSGWGNGGMGMFTKYFH
ncbi:MAG: hypothetical protein LBG77_01785 [Dysgonamonadaceae bacterium]|nr:hypothetical protein [Dysgonamonadaceae bacterium]